MSDPRVASLVELLDTHPARPDDVLLYGAESARTRTDVDLAVTRLADRLRELGIEPGDAVASVLPNDPGVIVAMMAIWRAGAVYVPINARAPLGERQRILDVIRPSAVVDGEGVHATAYQVQRYDPAVAFVTWTSGTTGPPKAILHTHAGYLELLDRVLRSLRKRTRSRSGIDRTLIPVSLALNSGLYNALFGLRAGTALVIMERFTTAEFVRLVRKFGIRSTVLPPAAIAMLVDEPDLDTLAPLRYVRSITAPLSPLLARRFQERFGVVVLNGYGQAEVGEVIGWTAADARRFPEKIGAVGRPHNGVLIKIRQEDGTPAPPNQIGELLVRPPQYATGYATGESLVDRVDADGYVSTGDLAYLDDDGFVWISGRVGDVINRGGNKVFPDEVEEVLRLSPHVTEVAVVGVPDSRLGEVPVAFVVDAKTASPADDDTLAALCREHLVAYKVPVAFHHVDELPRSEIGKILRAELAATFLAEEQPSA